MTSVLKISSLVLLFTLVNLHLRAAEPLPADLEFFEARVRPVLIEYCYKCHSAESKSIKGGLRLDVREGLLKGGDSGPSIIPGDPEKSLLIKAVRYTDDDMLMPPKQKLSPQQIADLETWVQKGAPDPRSDTAAAKTSPAIDFAKARQFWSFQPVRMPALPKSRHKDWEASPIDRFIYAEMKARKLKPNKPADKRTLIRRATFDLTGLPPTPEEVAEFLNDDAPDAFARLIDRLLASPRYGERWGRHWLDVARYADTAGETADFPVPDAYRYRNYVIDAFNQDKPYDDFIREQIAGDILAEHGPREKYAERVIATGYLALSRRFGSTHEQHLMIEDTLDTLGKSLLGLSLGCARCHDHKYDPVETADYYALYGIFDSTRYAFPGAELEKKPRDFPPLLPKAEVDAQVKPYEAALAPLSAALKKADEDRKASETEAQQLAKQIKSTLASGSFTNGGRQDFSAGQNAQSLSSVQVAAGDMLQLSILPKENHYNDTTVVEFEITELSGLKRTWNLTADCMPDLHGGGKGNPHCDSHGHENVWHFYDGAAVTPLLFFADSKVGLLSWTNPSHVPVVGANPTDKEVPMHSSRVPARTLYAHPSLTGSVVIAWQSPLTGAVAVKGRVIDADAQNGDGIAWRIDVLPSLDAPFAKLRRLIPVYNEAKFRHDEHLAKAPQFELAYGVSEGEAKNAKIQRRGEPRNLGNEVPRRFLQILGGQPLPAKTPGSGRLQLAEWLVHPENPLTARVMVNRIWQHHFGRGLVKTPSDFGTRGAPPTHPALLDYLAAQFVAGGWSIKQMHRLIMLSQTYQLSCDDNAKSAQIDPGNDFYWRFNRQRLAAEAIRDAILFVSGELDQKQGGAHPFPPRGTWAFTQHNPFKAVYEHNLRSVYLMTQRTQRHPFLALFDAADPNTTTAERRVTTVPTQALFFMNDPFLHAKAEKFAARVTAAAADDPARVAIAYRQLFARDCTDAEIDTAQGFLQAYEDGLATLSTPAEQRARLAWTAYARVLFSSNEFIHVE